MFSKLIDLFFPIICIGCEREGNYLCKDCKKNIRPHPELCPGCHISSPLGSVCYMCRSVLPGIDRVGVAFIYEKLIKKLIIDLKFKHRHDTGTYLGEKLGLLLLSNPLIDPNTTIISHIPSHRRRRYVQKGYNQSEILAKTVAEYTGIKHITLFQKTKYTKSQTKLKKEQRKTSLTNTFQYTQVPSIPDSTKTLVLIDDIVTTGSTLNSLGSLFKSYHPTLRVEGLVVGRHMG